MHRRPPPSQDFFYPNHSSGQRYHPPAWHNPSDDACLWCDFCGGYFAPCTSNSRKPCHFQRIVFVDGACSYNGSKDERPAAGVGAAFGTGSKSKISRPVDSTLDPNLQAPKTNQRAEILAAIVGLEALGEDELQMEARNRPCGRRAQGPPQWIVASDSKYVVNAMTEWMDSWKERYWRTSEGKIPANIDLFRRLDTLVHTLEARFWVEIRFWWIPREQIQLADELAKAGADLAKTLQKLESVDL